MRLGYDSRINVFTAVASLLLFSTAIGASSPLQFDITISQRVRAALSGTSARRDITQPVGIGTDPDFYTITLNATLGSPPQELELLVATSAADLLVLSNKTTTCQQGECVFGSFKDSASTSYNSLSNNFTISFGDGSAAEGNYAIERLVLAGTTIDSFQFGLVQQGSLKENILGLGYIDGAGTSTSYANLPLRLYNSGVTKINGYSLWFNDANSPDGKLALGGVDTGKFNGTLETVTIQKDPSGKYYYPTVSMDSVGASIDGTGTEFSNSSAIISIDTGTTVTYLPTNVVTQIMKYLGVTDYDRTQQLYYQAYSAMKNDTTIDFVFGTTTIQVPLTRFIGRGNATHGLLLLADAATYQNTLGIGFLRSAFTVFDYGNYQVSLAQAVFNSESNVTLISASGAAGLRSTANNGTLGTSSTTPSSSSTRNPESSSSAPSGGLTTSEKVGIGIGVGLGVPILLMIAGAGIFYRRRKRRAVAAPPESEVTSLKPEPTDRYSKAELPAVGESGGMQEKHGSLTQDERHELDSKRAVAPPVEMLGSVPEPQEMASSASYPAARRE